MPRENSRPRFKPKLSLLDWIVESMAIFITTCQWIHLLIEFPRLPTPIPIHYDFLGHADAYGSKSTLLFIPILSSVIAVLLTWLNRFPHAFNYPMPITATNASQQYLLATRLVRILKLIIMILFTAIETHSIQLAQHQPSHWQFVFTSLILTIVIAPFVYLIISTGKKMI
jgi:uncharacterized membrane protein